MPIRIVSMLDAYKRNISDSENFSWKSVSMLKRIWEMWIFGAYMLSR